MAYDDGLAERIRGIFESMENVVEKKMFGGLCFMVNGHMCCGLTQEDLMIRVGKPNYEKTLKKEYARPMDFTGKPLTGMIYVASRGISEDQVLKDWVQLGLDFVKTLPPK